MISVAVMAHPRRAALVEELVERLDGPATVIDDERDNEWDTGRRALLARDVDAEWHLVLQDDAIVCRDLVAGLSRALEHVPARSPVGLYVGRRRPLGHTLPEKTARADELHASWLTMGHLHWGLATCLPTAVLEDVVAEGDDLKPTEYDVRVSTYFGRRRIPVYYTWPSLVDHRDGESLLAGRPHEGRVAYRFLGENASALDVDWSGPVATVNALGPSVAFRSKQGRVVVVPENSPAAARYRKKTKHWTEETNDPGREGPNGA